MVTKNRLQAKQKQYAVDNFRFFYVTGCYALPVFCQAIIVLVDHLSKAVLPVCLLCYLYALWSIN